MPDPSAESPFLAPPGAGLPWPELGIARMLFTVSRWFYNRDAAARKFLQEQDRISALIAGCSPTLACQRVLIPRLRGLEDSSRYWSVAMTLDHLRITNAAFADIILCLVKHTIPDGVASTAAVKPSADVSMDVVHDYNESCSRLLAAVGENLNLNTSVKFAHPWFGPMNAEDWHLLTGTHMGIHRKQIECILKHLA